MDTDNGRTAESACPHYRGDVDAECILPRGHKGRHVPRSAEIVLGWNPHWNYRLGGEPRSICACPDGPYEGARLATLPRFCERCGGLVSVTPLEGGRDTPREWHEGGDGHGYVYQYIGPIHYLCECGDYFLNRERWLAHKADATTVTPPE